MQPKKKIVSKKVAPAPLAVKKVETKKVVNPLFEKRAKTFGIGKFPSIVYILCFFEVMLQCLCTFLKCIFHDLRFRPEHPAQA